MEKFLGKFQALPEKTEEFDAYFEAMKIPEEARQIMRDNNVITCLFKEGEDFYKEFNDFGDGRLEEFVFKLGVPFTATALGMETKNTFTLTANGERIDGISEVGGQTTTTSRYIQGDLMVFESHGNGTTMKTFFKRLPS